MRGNVHTTTQKRHFQRALAALMRARLDLNLARRLIASSGQDTIGEDKIEAELVALLTLLDNGPLSEVEHGLYLLKRSVEKEGPLREEGEL